MKLNHPLNAARTRLGASTPRRITAALGLLGAGLLGSACVTSEATELCAGSASQAADPAANHPRHEPDPSPELEEILEDVPIPDLLPAAEARPVDPPENEADEPVTLDETALLACASAHFAWVAVQSGNDAEIDTDLGVAAIRAGESTVPAISELSKPLALAVDLPNPTPTIDGFMKVCRSNGFETG